MKNCPQCLHSALYRGRLICKLFRGCSVQFARDEQGECGPDAKHFEAR